MASHRRCKTASFQLLFNSTVKTLVEHVQSIFDLLASAHADGSLTAKNKFNKDKTHLSGVQDVQKYGKNTNKKHGARHFCGRVASQSRTDDGR